VSDPTPPRPDDLGRPGAGGTPPSPSGGTPDPGASEFLTPVHPYESIDPGAGPGAGGPGNTPSGRRMGLVLLAVVVVLAVIAGVAYLATTGGADAAPGAPRGFDAAVDLCATPACDRITVTVALTWQAPEGGSVTGYEVLEDGALIDRLQADTTSFTVRGLDIGQQYTFGVQAMGPGGTGPATEASVETPTPPLAESQLDGSYGVTMRVRSVRNISSFLGIDNPRLGSTSNTRWSFAATCGADQGACPVRWFGRGPIPPKGRGYAGSFQDDAATCAGSGKTPVTATMNVVTVDAKADGPRWLVQRFHGTFAVEFDCPGAGGISRGVVEVDGHRL
jgi:hypothetical protein